VKLGLELIDITLTTLVMIGTDCIGIVVNPTTIRSRPQSHQKEEKS